MARIRTIKPEFFRHEGLQDLEIANPGKYPMMVFEGLWGHCDSKGRFEWRPRQLKLDILPFLPFDMAETLAILAESGMVKRYEVDGKEYGEIPSFEKHQRISGKELTDGEKYPEPNREATGKQRGSVGEIPESQEGKGTGREQEQEGNGVGANAPLAPSEPNPPEKKTAKRATQLPDGFWPNDAGLAYADDRSIRGEKFTAELTAFKNWHTAKGSTYKDWQAAWRTWCDKAVEFGRSKGGAPPSKQAHRDSYDAQAKAAQERIFGNERRAEIDITADAERIA